MATDASFLCRPGAVEREVAEPDRREEVQPRADLLPELGGDLLRGTREGEPVEERERVVDREPGDVDDAARVDAHRAFIEREAGADLYTGGAIDIDAPEVTITSPAAGARPEPSFTLEADAVDAASGITRVELWIEGTRQGELSAAPYRFEVSGLERRCYDVEVRAVDGAENVGRATRQICIADGDPFGAPCQADATCGSGLCLGGACSQACTSLKPCPEGYDCTSNQCVAQPGAGGGCAAAPGAGVGRLLPLLLLSLLSLLALAFRRRLRRRCQTAARPRR